VAKSGISVVLYKTDGKGCF